MTDDEREAALRTTPPSHYAKLLRFDEVVAFLLRRVDQARAAGLRDAAALAEIVGKNPPEGFRYLDVLSRGDHEGTWYGAALEVARRIREIIPLPGPPG